MGKLEDYNIILAISKLEKLCLFMKILGNYQCIYSTDYFIQRLNIGIKVKQAHYKYTHKYCQDNKMDTESLIYLGKFDEMNKLQLNIKDNIFVDKYINTVNENIDQIYKGWWSEVVSIQEFEKYENTVN